jgi:Flp pilus assembly pilin Flp
MTTNRMTSHRGDRKSSSKEKLMLRTFRSFDPRSELGQATAEYALVMVAAAVVALALISWASTTDMLPSFFNTVMQKVISVANRA